MSCARRHRVARRRVMASESRSGFQVSRSHPAIRIRIRIRSRVEPWVVCHARGGDMHRHRSGVASSCAGRRSRLVVVAGRREGVTVSRDDEVRSRRDDSVRLPLLHFRADLVSLLADPVRHTLACWLQSKSSRDTRSRSWRVQFPSPLYPLFERRLKSPSNSRYPHKYALELCLLLRSCVCKLLPGGSGEQQRSRPFAVTWRRCCFRASFRSTGFHPLKSSLSLEAPRSKQRPSREPGSPRKSSLRQTRTSASCQETPLLSSLPSSWCVFFQRVLALGIRPLNCTAFRPAPQFAFLVPGTLSAWPRIRCTSQRG